MLLWPPGLRVLQHNMHAQRINGKLEKVVRVLDDDCNNVRQQEASQSKGRKVAEYVHLDRETYH